MIWYNSEWENPLYWFDKLLTYSDHAEMRRFERDLPLLDFLPVNSKYLYHILKKDMYSMTFETTVNHKKMHIAISSLGTVMTVFPVLVTKADRFQFKYKQYLGAFKQPDDYLPPVITSLDFTDAEFSDAEFLEGVA